MENSGKVRGGGVLLGTKRALREHRAPSTEQWNFLRLNIFAKLFTVDFSPDAFHPCECVSVLCTCVGECTCCRVFVWVLKIFERHALEDEESPQKYPTIWPAVFWPPFGPNLNAAAMAVEFSDRLALFQGVWHPLNTPLDFQIYL